MSEHLTPLVSDYHIWQSLVKAEGVWSLAAESLLSFAILMNSFGKKNFNELLLLKTWSLCNL